jgi:hypothetical protein
MARLAHGHEPPSVGLRGARRPARSVLARPLLDLGTGGGEWLAALPVRPPRTVATEAWQPNVDVARARLGPLGVTVVRAEGAPDNVDQNDDEQRSSLPFPDESFRLVVCRHEAYMPMEVARILVAGGHFVTQQVGGDYGDFYRLLGLPGLPRQARKWNLTLATAQLEAAGLRLLAAEEGEETTTFADVGAFVWYLRAVPWALPGFTASEHLSSLRELHARLVSDGPAAVCMPAFFLEATKAAAS